MNTDTLELTPTLAQGAAVEAALEAVARLFDVGARALSHDAQTHVQALLRSGAHVDVRFHFEHGKTCIAAALEGVPFFTITLGSGEVEATRH